MNILGRDECDCSGLDLGDPVLDLALPGCLSFDIGLAFQRVQQFFCEACAILGRQGLWRGRTAL